MSSGRRRARNALRTALATITLAAALPAQAETTDLDLRAAYCFGVTSQTLALDDGMGLVMAPDARAFLQARGVRLMTYLIARGHLQDEDTGVAMTLLQGKADQLAVSKNPKAPPARLETCRNIESALPAER